MGKAAAQNVGGKPPLDIDAILNRHRVNLARSQRVIDAWHPKTQEDLARVDGDDKDAAANFDDLLRPELAGLGADLSLNSKSGIPGSAAEGELGQLRKQLLGRKTASNDFGRKEASGRQQNSSHAGIKRKPASGEASDSDSDSDSEGRSTIFKSNRAKTQKASRPPKIVNQHDPGDTLTSRANPSSSIIELNISHGRKAQPDAQEKDVQNRPPTSASDSEKDVISKVASTSVLDQVIAERKKKKKKKKKKKQNRSEGDS